MQKFKVLSLFSNVGIGEYLLPKNFEVVLANELSAPRCEVYKKLYPGVKMIQGDIQENKEEIIKSAKKLGVNVIVATPPCQSFSNINTKKVMNDPRDFLVCHAVDIVSALNPELAVFENVAKQRSLMIGDTPYENWIHQRLPQYESIIFKILNSANFGVPQRRTRLFSIISHIPFEIIGTPGHIMLKEAIGNLPSLEANAPATNDRMHFGPPTSARHVLWAQHTPTGKSAFDNPVHYPSVFKNGVHRKIKGFPCSYRRMKWDAVSYTITSNHCSSGGANTLHPGRLLENGLYSDARTLTLREAAIVMGLPNTFFFPPEVNYREGIRYLGEGLSPVVLREVFKAWYAAYKKCHVHKVAVEEYKQLELAFV